MLRLIDLPTVLAAAVIFLPLEHMLPRHRYTEGRPALLTDLCHLILSGAMITLGATATVVVLAAAIGTILPPGLGAAAGEWPVWVQFPVLLLLSDLCFYAAHRLVHTAPALWRFHAIHHSSERMDWLATYRVHPVDQIINSTIIALPAVALHFSPGVVLLYALLYKWHAMLLHSNVRLEIGRFGRLIASPRFHHWHHADDRRAYDRNFGGQLAIWDYLLGTAFEDDHLPARYGAGEPVPASYPEQLLQPFRRAAHEVPPAPQAEVAR
jgi:sterol desaturase/sphingolipid hydroxylase (fatty acid hydroxylase superfamily)